MKPVVSSLVALAMAVAPLAALAKPADAENALPAKVVKPKTEKRDSARRSKRGARLAPEKPRKVESVQSRVKTGKKDVSAKKQSHAHGVDLTSVDHREPKSADTLVVASTASTASTSTREAGDASKGALLNHASMKSSDAPKLPKPSPDKVAEATPSSASRASSSADKTSKGGSEKGKGRSASRSPSSNAASESARSGGASASVARSRKRRDAKDVEKASNEERVASADKNGGRPPAKAPCTKTPVEVIRGPEVERFALTKCDGTFVPYAVERLSILARPGGVARPTAPLAELAKKPGPELARGIRRIDARLVERIQAIAEHFGKPNAPAKLFVISGFRPASVGSMHSSGRAIDFRVEGVKNEDVVMFCKTLADTGCGFYPNSSFVHVDVREGGAGHVSWIDASGPGEAPRYVSVWPPPASPRRADEVSVRRANHAPSQTDLAEEGESLLRARRPMDHDSTLETIDDYPAAITP